MSLQCLFRSEGGLGVGDDVVYPFGEGEAFGGGGGGRKGPGVIPLMNYDWGGIKRLGLVVGTAITKLRRPKVVTRARESPLADLTILATVSI